MARTQTTQAAQVGTSPDLGRLLIVTGAQAAGKTTLGRALAAQLPRAVHIDGDAIHQLVVSGEVSMDVPPPPGALEQLHLRYAGGIAVARVYREAGFDAVFTDNIFGEDLLAVLDLPATGTGDGPVGVIVLDPDLDALRRREHERPKSGYTESITPEGLLHAVRVETPRLGLWLDTSDQSVPQTVAAVLARLDETTVTAADLAGA